MTDGQREGLTHDEDGVLRRLHFFETAVGARLAAPLAELKQTLRAQDLRRAVRDPWESRVLSPR